MTRPRPFTLHAVPFVVLSFVAACGGKATPAVGNTTAPTPSPAPRGAVAACAGRWLEPKTSSRLVLDQRAGVCGRMDYPVCAGDLTDCRYSEGRVLARYTCVSEEETFHGTLDMTCNGNDATVVDSTDGHGVYTDAFVRE